ncbi:mobilization protein [Pedobacter yonginense]|jgi:predicted CopG family antitoxin|uniref:Mobilization protein n=1 Tax=Pedobacter yonginense TaxID=651869 RepID=A0A317ETC1_9SPHI|nr:MULTISPECIES: plasmid mobilization relaxosome protein MobC [Pedobacter]PWS28496.1 mobilization protein [Pedobacter yonginense]
MPRKRATNQDALLTKNVIVRITETTFNKLEKMRVESGSASMAEVIRRILSNRKIKLLHQDNSLNAPMEEMALIRKELKAIGININQITRTFNQDKVETHRAFYVMKVAELYKNVDERVEKLLVIISQLAEKWLQK